MVLPRLDEKELFLYFNYFNIRKKLFLKSYFLCKESDSGFKQFLPPA